MNVIDFPQNVDEPPQLLLWEIDEVIPVAILLGIGIMTNLLTYCIVLSYPVIKKLQKFKLENPRGMMMHAVYWIGLAPMKTRITNGQQRNFGS